MREKFVNIRIENIFLFIAITIGLIFVFVTPPFQGPDEFVHFARAYQISEFKVYEVKSENFIGGYIPESLKYVMAELDKEPIIQHNPQNKVKISKVIFLFNIPLNKNVKSFVEFSAAAAYFPIMYLPQSMGIGIAKLFNLTPLKLFYFGRIFNLIIWAVLTYFSIKLIPIGKKVMFLLSLSPMILFQAATLSPDGITNGIAFLMIAVILKYAFDEKPRIGLKEIWVLLLLSSALALCKQAYFLIFILYFLIPVKKFQSKRKYYSVFMLIMLINVVLILLWAFSARHTIVDARPGVSMYNQLFYILKNPISYVKIFIGTFLHHGTDYIGQWVGRLGWMDTYLPKTVIYSYIIVLLFTALTDNESEIKIDIKQKILVLISFLAGVAITATLLYLTYNEVGRSYIMGIQGRYFIPLGPLVYLLIYNRQFSIKGNKMKWVLSTFTIVYLAAAIFTLINRYYIS